MPVLGFFLLVGSSNTALKVLPFDLFGEHSNEGALFGASPIDNLPGGSRTCDAGSPVPRERSETRGVPPGEQTPGAPMWGPFFSVLSETEVKPKASRSSFRTERFEVAGHRVS